jgi:O-antigen/teichoic acid export membrane protein
MQDGQDGQRDVGTVVARNSLSSLGAQMALKILSFAYNIAIIRNLGDENFGIYATVGAFVGILAVFGDFGMSNYAVREIAKDRSKASKLFGNLVMLRAILATLVLIVNTCLALLLGYPAQLVGLIAFSSAGLLLYSLQGPISVVLQGHERIDFSSTLNVVNQVTLIGVGAVLLWLGFGIPGIIMAGFVGVLAMIAVGWRWASKLAPLKFEIDTSIWWSLLKAGLPFGITTFATMLSFRMDTVLLNQWRTPEEVGWYNVAYNLIFSLLMISSAFNSTLVPSLSRQYTRDPTSVKQFYMGAVRMLWIASIPIAFGTTLLAERIIELLYGSEFLPASNALQILIWVMPILTVTSLCGSISTVLHREKATARLNIINAVFNISLNVWAIPRYGLLGAAIMTVATEFLGLTQYTMLLRDAFPIKAIATALIRPLIASLVMCTVVLLIWSLPLLAIIPIAGLVYVITLVACGGIKLDEVRSIGNAIASVFARRRAPAAK